MADWSLRAARLWGWLGPGIEADFGCTWLLHNVARRFMELAVLYALLRYHSVD